MTFERSDTDKPDGLLESLVDIPFVCPRCHGELDVSAQGYACRPCERQYPLHAGIPDFRVFPDPYLDYEADHDRTEIVLRGLDKYPLQELLEYYWSFSDVTPLDLRARFIRSAMLGEGKANRLVGLLQDAGLGASSSVRRVLEIGSGTGPFLVAAAAQYPQVVGIDIGMRWLHVSRRRFIDKGLPVPPLVCCCAEHLPFENGYFDLMTASATLEFSRQPDRVLSESSRVLGPDGAFYLSTVNRFSIARNPYVYLWGLGFMPTRWQVGYVRWRRNASYENIRLQSLRSLRKLAAKYFPVCRMELPDIDEASLAQLSASTRGQVRIYRFLKALPLVRTLLLGVAPQWDVWLRKSGETPVA